jgi:hypothetical protein
MNNFKFNIDRPKISSKDIRNKMNFEEILTNHQLMTTSFYKSPWFFGTTGLATITIIATTIYGFDNKSGDVVGSIKNSEIATVAPPVINLNQNQEERINKKDNKIIELPIEEKSTLTKQKLNKKYLNNNIASTGNLANEEITELVPDETIISEHKENENKVFNYFDFHPRISGKVNGDITKQELFNDKGLVTNTNVEIVHFELHLINGLGGRVFEENGHLLTNEMKEAISNVEIGDEIYFEDIQGVTKKGENIKLNPLRFTVLN